MTSGHVDLEARRAGIGACLVAQLSGMLSGLPVLPNVRKYQKKDKWLEMMTIIGPSNK